MTEKEILQIDTLIYLDVMQENMTIGECLNDYILEENAKVGVYPCLMSEIEWNTLLDEVRRNENLMNTAVSNYLNSSTGFRAATFTDSRGDKVVVFRGTSGLNQWVDNGIGVLRDKTGTREEAVEYMNNLKIHNQSSVTVSGHSNGGNLAEYVTLYSDANIGKCISYSGQGFSKALYNSITSNLELMEKTKKITAINPYNDIVGDLLYKVAGKIKLFDPGIDILENTNIKNDVLGKIGMTASEIFSHKPNSAFTENVKYTENGELISTNDENGDLIKGLNQIMKKITTSTNKIIDKTVNLQGRVKGLNNVEIDE